MQQELGRNEGREIMEGEGEEMKSMITQQMSLRDHHHHHHQHGQNGHFHESQNSGPHPQDDDFMEQMLSTINPDCANAWSPHSHSSNPVFPALPLTLATSDVVHPPFKPPSPQVQGGEGRQVPELFKGFVGSLHGNAQPPSHHHQQQHFHHPSQDQFQGGVGKNYGGQTTAMMNTDQAPGAPPTSASTGGSTGTAPQRQRVRARRGQATDPHSIAERLRRERIAERMKSLQELVPNGNKTDKASMLDEIIDYLKFLQLQVKVLSMSRLGGAAAVAPLGADMSSEGGLRRKNISGNATNESMTVTEHQVAKLMEEDMGSAMQYLQGKGLCLMPISLATAISTATTRNPLTSATTRLPPTNINGDPNNDNANTNQQLNLAGVGVQFNMNLNNPSSSSTKP